MYDYCLLLYLLFIIYNILLDNDWESVEARREFFINFAKEMEFDPYTPDNWYKVTRADVLKKRVFIILIFLYFD